MLIQTFEKAAQMGRKAAKYCDKNGIEIGSIVDPRYGRVNTYPFATLEHLFPFHEYAEQETAETQTRCHRPQSTCKH